ncbi:hypothetical protein [Neolewinella litorea]|uniref:Uncharacterized protein n=1 Tax=Neolewinella litorea TaxID=2562452 RepID=A0A4S4NAF1_9BACT|nr:hypothetical protein [Neolewinella litorea]THH36292.1 hypothetical protein E4021_15390 [Neolewinella litorea]
MSRYRIAITVYAVPILVFILGAGFRYDWMIDVALWLFLINAVLSFIIALRSPKRKLLAIGLSLCMAVGLFVLVSFILTFATPDYYGAHKEIPEGIDIYEPIDSFPAFANEEGVQLQLVNSFQPGIYYYTTNFKPYQEGELHLKVFDIQTNERLSSQSILEDTKMVVSHSDTILYAKEFTIYEGSWGDKYGARFELLFRSDKGGKDSLIIAKNFIVEGWMR